jgi:hypothetical protein
MVVNQAFNLAPGKQIVFYCDFIKRNVKNVIAPIKGTHCCLTLQGEYGQVPDWQLTKPAAAELVTLNKGNKPLFKSFVTFVSGKLKNCRNGLHRVSYAREKHQDGAARENPVHPPNGSSRHFTTKIGKCPSVPGFFGKSLYA